MISQLLKVLRESMKAVPAMKYALAVAGILAVVAMVGAFRVSPQTAVFGSIITLVLMVAMVIFARLTTTAPRHFFLPVKIMMWAFLIVTVATAFLLFTSAFFQWPRGLREIVDAKSPTPVVRGDESEDVRNLVAAANQQRLARNYTGAWSAIERALSLAPDSKAARAEQLQIALVWIRNMSVPDGRSFADAVRPLLDCLHLNAVTAQSVLAADIHAHLGWATYLPTQFRPPDETVIAHYKAALALDASNPFAHAMWGHGLARHRRPVPEIRARFELALKPGRERDFVQEFRIYAYKWLDTPESDLELLRMADGMRRRQEPLASPLRSAIYNTVYATFKGPQEQDFLTVLPASDHLATFHWIADGRDVNHSAYAAYFLARLTEATGDFAGAASRYRRLLEYSISFEDPARQGLARCEKHLGKK
jgi:tetratricopeptide (TPR) repeat protein